MIRVVLGVAVAFVSALLLVSLDEDARRRRDKPVRVDPVAGVVDVGPKVVRSIRIDPCEAQHTFVEMWRCRVP